MIYPSTIFLNWLLALPFFGAAGAELFSRFARHLRSEEEARDTRERGPFALGALASLMGAALAATLLHAVWAGERLTADYWWMQGLYPLRFQADFLGASVALVIFLAGLLIHLHLLGRAGGEESGHRAALLLLAQGGASSAALSADIVVLLFMLCLTILALSALASRHSSPQAQWLFIAGHGGWLLVLVGALVMWREAGDTSLVSLPLLLLSAPPETLRLIGLATLLGVVPLLAVFPVHGWLPALARVSPGLVLGPVPLLMLAGGGVLLRLLPGSLELPLIPAVPAICVMLGLATLWWGALRAWLSRSLVGLAVWVTVAQSGYLLVALGAAGQASPPPELLQAASLHVLLGSIALVGLWSSVLVTAERAGTDSLAGLSGLYKVMPVAGATLLVSGLSLAGCPLLAGYSVQRLLIEGVLDRGRPLLATGLVVVDILLAIAVLNALRQAFLRREAAPSLRPASIWSTLALSLVSLILVTLGVWTTPAVNLARMITRSVLSLSP